MRVTSRIKSIFNDELLRYTASICDTKRIESNAEKMVTLGNLLYTNGINFEILGGATNRIALQIDGYAVKFAMDEQGYLDNMIEYSLSPELQPYVTRSFETNGYILVAECVEVFRTEAKFRLYKDDIIKILDALSQDYLLGDVGYIAKNMTNWGLRDGRPVILDYAYCHRATENLFTCSRCGQPLMYDSSYDVLLCTDRVSCKARYTYNERKRIQGKEVDEKMVMERKADSIKMQKGVISKDIELFEDRLLGDNYFLIDNPGDAYRYEKLKEALEMNLNMNGERTDMEIMDGLTALVRLAKNSNDEEAKKVIYQDLNDESPQIPEPVYTDNYQEHYRFGYVPPMRVHNNLSYLPISPQDSYEEEPEDNGDNQDEEYSTVDDLVRIAKEKRAAKQRAYEEAQRSQEDAYLADLKRRQEQEAREAAEKERQERERAEQAERERIEREAAEAAERAAKDAEEQEAESVVEEVDASVENEDQVDAEEESTEYSTTGFEEENREVIADDSTEEIPQVEEQVAGEPFRGESVNESPSGTASDDSVSMSSGISINGKPINIGQEVTYRAGK